MIHLHFVTREEHAGPIGFGRSWTKVVTSIGSFVPRKGEQVWVVADDTIELDVIDVYYDANLHPHVFLQTVVVDPTTEYEDGWHADSLRRQSRHTPVLWRPDSEAGETRQTFYGELAEYGWEGV